MACGVPFLTTSPCIAHVWSEDDILNSKELNFPSLFYTGSMFLEDKDCYLLTCGYKVPDSKYEAVS